MVARRGRCTGRQGGWAGGEAGLGSAWCDEAWTGEPVSPPHGCTQAWLTAGPPELPPSLDLFLLMFQPLMPVHRYSLRDDRGRQGVHRVPLALARAARHAAPRRAPGVGVVLVVLLSQRHGGAVLRQLQDHAVRLGVHAARVSCVYGMHGDAGARWHRWHNTRRGAARHGVSPAFRSRVLVRPEHAPGNVQTPASTWPHQSPAQPLLTRFLNFT